MFIQFIKAQTSDPDGVRREGERWEQEVRPGAIGFLGSTAGFADDGTFVLLARFTDEAAARANSQRPEQGELWDALAKHLDGEPTFRESSDVTLLFDGGSDTAGFVQVMEGTVRDRAAVDAFMTPDMADQLRAARPDLLGAVTAWFADGTFVEAAYFTSEAAARAGEASDTFSAPQQEFAALFTEMTFLDLRDPILVAP